MDKVIGFLSPNLGGVLAIRTGLTRLLWYVAQFVSVAADGAGSQHVDRDTVDRQVPVVHVYSRLHLCDHVGIRAQPHSEDVFHSHDAIVHSQRVH